MTRLIVVLEFDTRSHYAFEMVIACYRPPAILTLMVLSMPVAACLQQISVPSQHDFDSEEYVFIGRELDLFKISNKQDPPAWGLRVRVAEAINMPSGNAGAVFDLYPRTNQEYFAEPGLSYDEASLYAGRRLRVIAKKYAETTQGRNPALVVSVENGLSLDGVTEELLTTASSVYDFSEYAYYRDLYCPEFMRSCRSLHGLAAFELRKDMARLHRSEAASEKKVILERLAYHPQYRQGRSLERNLASTESYANLVKRYILDPKEQERLISRFGKFLSERPFESTAKDFLLQGLISSADGNFQAIIGNKVVGLGEVVDGVKIVAIDKDRSSVVIERNGRRIRQYVASERVHELLGPDPISTGRK